MQEKKEEKRNKEENREWRKEERNKEEKRKRTKKGKEIREKEKRREANRRVKKEKTDTKREIVRNKGTAKSRRIEVMKMRKKMNIKNKI